MAEKHDAVRSGSEADTVDEEIDEFLPVVSTTPMVEIVAPSNLPEGYTFQDKLTRTLSFPLLWLVASEYDELFSMALTKVYVCALACPAVVVHVGAAKRRC